MTALFWLGMVICAASGCILGRAIAGGAKFVGACAVVVMVACIAVIVLARVS